MSLPTTQHEPHFTVIGGDEPTDELLEALADLLLAIVDAEEAEAESALRFAPAK